MIKWLAILLLTASTACGLTPVEKAQLKQVQALVHTAISKWSESETHIALADQRAQEAIDHALVTDHRADMLQVDLDQHYENEKRLSSMVNQYKPFWDTGHKWWGIGAIGLGLGILLKHALITVAILAIAAILISIFAPGAIGVVRAFFGAAMSWIKNLIGRFKR